jgi:uncharacterized protein YecA (UPF0149 family)
MNVNTGEIMSSEEMLKQINSLKAERDDFMPLGLESIQEHESRKNKKIGRNEQCPCHSGKKYKKCCLLKKHKLNKKESMGV